jgi:branched-chain amino acid transport system ATP-binding protein
MVPILKTERLTKSFGALCAVNDLSLEVEPFAVTGLIGPNGAGKSTVFNLITGFIKPTSGHVFYKGKDVTNVRPNKICAMGVSRTFQLVNNFPEFTVLHNVLIGGHLRARITPKTFINWPSKKEVEEATEVLRLTGLEHLSNEVASSLSSGQQKSLQFAIALMSRPELLLLDEPLSGMTPGEMDFILNIIRDISSNGVTILLIEHNMKAVMGICDRIFVIDFGSYVFDGPPALVRSHPDVVRIYLGEEEEIAV